MKPRQPEKVFLNVARLRLVLLADPELARQLREWANPFTDSPPETPTATYELTTEAYTTQMGLFSPEVHVSLAGAQLRMNSKSSFQAEIGLDSQRGSLAYSDRPGLEGRRIPPPAFLSAMKSLLAVLLVHHGGLLLHSSGIRHPNGSAGLFFGRSGAGKTTFTRMFPREYVLNDELTAVRVHADGIELHSTPLGQPDTRPAQSVVPAGKLLLGCTLKVGSEVRLTEVTGSQALNNLMQCVALPAGVRQLEAQSFDIAASIITRATWGILYFPKNADAVRPRIEAWLSGREPFRR